MRLEQTHDQSDVPREKIVVGGNHVTVSLPLGSSSSTRDDTILKAQRHLTVTSHGEGKGEGARVKSENKTSSKHDNLSVTYSTQFEVAEEMQWEKVHHQALRKAPIEVNPISTPTFTFSPSISDLSGKIFLRVLRVNI